MDTNVVICGEAGQGVQTVGALLLNALTAMGLHVYGTQSYHSRIRGGENNFDVRISDKELFSAREKVDLMVALTEEGLENNRNRVAEEGIIVFDGRADGVISLDLAEAASAAGGSKQMANSVALGVIMTIQGYETGELEKLIEKQFGKKGEDVVSQNISCVKKGVELIEDRKGSVEAPGTSEPAGEAVNGAQVIGLAADTAGVKVVCSYPMSPSTGVFTYLAGVSDKYRIAVEQAEDEIAAINVVCGATYAGVPAMTTTSGGGFALMAEGLSLAGMMELPAVIMIGQRPGPSTGLPTADPGFVTPAQVHGVILEPANPLAMGIAEDVSFVARSAAADREHLVEMMVEAMKVEGFALLDILQTCVSFNREKSVKWFKENTEKNFRRP